MTTEEKNSGDVEPEKLSAQQLEENVVSPSPPILEENNAHVTAKTWVCIFVLSSCFGLSFWPVPTTAAMQSKLVAKLGDPTSVYWYVPAYTTANSIGFLLAGANSDIFGRRLFLLTGEAICCVGFIITAAARNSNQFIAGLAITGFGGGMCQMAMCSIPELMPNKYRHIGITISDGFVFVIVVIGPVVGRYAIDSPGNTWQYIFCKR
jgi:MFS family permease